MGSWGMGNFDNDTALNWVSDFVDSPKPGMVDEALRGMGDKKKQQDTAANEKALAAAEVVAAMNGKPSDEIPAELEDMLKNFTIKPNRELLTLARQSTLAVKTQSELRELWIETGDLEIWLEHIDDLLERLSA